MAVIVDSRHGYRRAVRSSPGGDLRPGVLEPRAMLKQLTGRTVDLGTGGGKLVLAPGSAKILPHMVWKPCQESLSPFVPFYSLQVGNRTIYARVDGKIFTKLRRV